MSRLVEAASRKADSKFTDLPNFAALVGEAPAVTTRSNYCEFGFNKTKMMSKDDNSISSFYAKAFVGEEARATGRSLMNLLNPGQEADDFTNAYAKFTVKLAPGF